MLLYLLPSWPKWSETFLRQDLSFLMKQGLPLFSAALFHGDCAPQTDWPQVLVLEDWDGEQNGRWTARASASHPKIPFAPGSAGPSADSLFSQCKKTLATWHSLWKHRPLLTKLSLLVQEKQIHHIHAEFADLPALLAARVAEKTGCTYSIGIHAADIHACKYPLDTLFANALFVTVCNQAAREAFCRQLPRYASKLHLIPHGVNLTFWEFQPRISEMRRLVFVGRLVPKKGLRLLFQAMALLPPPVSLDIVGEGPMQEELMELAEPLGITERIHWRGRQSPEGVREILQRSSALIMPSIVTPNGDRDGVPNVVLEAMASGIPVVGSQNGSLPEVLTEETGWCFHQDIPDALATAILQCLEKRSLTEQKRIRAHQLVQEKYNAETLALTRASLFLG